MFFRKAAGLIYFFIAVVTVYCISGYYYIEEEQSEYKNTIAQMKYQLGFSNLYFSDEDSDVTDAANTEDISKVVYLTFDDGPSSRTEEILDLLDRYDIKATFFVVYNDSEKAKNIIKRAYEDGHTIGVHSTSHSYKEIYKSVDSFLNDFEVCFEYLKDVTGDVPSIFRFPGGSVNNYNKSVRKEIAEELLRRGFTYFDWNVSGEDATKNYSEKSIYQNVVSGCRKHDSSVVLLHDSENKKETVAALEYIIPELIEEGYVFLPIDENVQPTIFKID